jgi:hypothetical protein
MGLPSEQFGPAVTPFSESCISVSYARTAPVSLPVLCRRVPLLMTWPALSAAAPVSPQMP